MHPPSAVHRIRKLLLTVALLCIAGTLFTYAFAVYQLQERERSFIETNPLAGFLSEARLIQGNLFYYRDEEYDRAAERYRLTILTEPSFMDGWIGLAKAELAAGRPEEARCIMARVAPILARVSTWKMDELELAVKLEAESSVGECLTYILARLPHHTQEACELASDFWEGWEEVVPHVGPEALEPFLRELMRVKEPVAALLVWDRMLQEGAGPEEATRLRFCQFLLDSGRVPEAKAVWCGAKSERCRGVHDGGLEQPPLNTAFGWRLGRHPEVLQERTTTTPYEGNWCLHLRFSGNKNLAFGQTLQIIPVEPGLTCHLRFARRSRNMTTDQGVYLEVSGYRCDGLRVASQPVAGSSEWTREDLEVDVPESCEAISLMVRRKESLKLDSKISGDYWLDSVELE